MKVIDKFKVFERVADGDVTDLNEGIISSLKNYVSRLFGGKVKKLDDIIKKYKGNEIKYWREWADNNAKYNEAELLGQVAKANPVKKASQEEVKTRVKKLQAELESAKRQIEESLNKQASVMIGTNDRLRDYYDLAKAKADVEVANSSYTELKKITDEKTVGDLYDRIEKTFLAAKKHDDDFKEKYGDLVVKPSTTAYYGHGFDDGYGKRPRRDMTGGEYSDYHVNQVAPVITGNPDIVTPNTVKEIGTVGINKAVDLAIKSTSDASGKVDMEKVEDVITKQTERWFADSKENAEDIHGPIRDEDWKHVQNDLTNLFGKLVFYYKQNKEPQKASSLKYGLTNFASELYKYKKANNILNRDLNTVELDQKFKEFKK